MIVTTTTTTTNATNTTNTSIYDVPWRAHAVALNTYILFADVQTQVQRSTRKHMQINHCIDDGV